MLLPQAHVHFYGGDSGAVLAHMKLMHCRSVASSQHLAASEALPFLLSDDRFDGLCHVYIDFLQHRDNGAGKGVALRFTDRMISNLSPNQGASAESQEHVSSAGIPSFHITFIVDVALT